MEPPAIRATTSIGAVLLLLVALVATGCGSDAPPDAANSATPTAGREVRVEVKLFQFMPGTVEVERGTTVAWTNLDDIGHTVTSGEPGAILPTFDSALEGVNARFAYVFDEPGAYAYFCQRHEGMRGEIRVS